MAKCWLNFSADLRKEGGGRIYLRPTELARAADEIRMPAQSEVKVVLDRNKKDESVSLEVLDKNNLRELSYG